MSSGAPDYWLKGKLVELIETINTVDLVTLIETINTIATITAISNVVNIESLDLIDLITTISTITNIENIESLDLIDEITLIDTISSITRILAIDEMGAITRIIEPVRVEGIDLLPSTNSYTFVGITSPSATHLAKFDDTSDYTTKDLGTEAEQADYDAIEASDDSRWAETETYCRLRFRFVITEDIEDITELKFTFEGHGGVLGIIYIWDIVDEEWKHGRLLFTSETTIVLSRKTSIERYVDKDGHIWFIAYCGASISCDLAKLEVVSYAPTPTTYIPVSVTKWGGTDLTAGDITLKLNNLDIALSTLRDAIVDAASPKDLKDLYDELAAIKGYVDGLETDTAHLDIDLSALRNAITDATTPKDLKDLYDELVAIKGYVDQLEGYLDTVETKLNTLHTDIGATLHGDVDDLETILTAIKDTTGVKKITDPVDVETVDDDVIMIDLLKQGAYKTRKATLTNPPGTPLYYGWTGNQRVGKHFPRGARGFIANVDVQCKDNAAAGGTITVYLAPAVSLPYLYSATVTVPAGGAATWRAASFNKFWPSDSLFIFCVSSNANIHQSYEDTPTIEDYFESADAGATWTEMNRTLGIRADIYAMAVGDVTVGGTVKSILMGWDTSKFVPVRVDSDGYLLTKAG